MASSRVEIENDGEQPAGVVTLAERKRLRVDQIRMGVAALREQLACYGRERGGRFWLFGSAASGRIHYDSDIDILVDFDEAHRAAAVNFAERACIDLRLRPDITPKSWCKDATIDRIKSSALILP